MVNYNLLGKLTRLAPIPKPAPERALTARDGKYVSKIENVAAATSAITITSSSFKRFEGKTYAANATISPSIKYFKARLNNSPRSKYPPISIYNK